MFSLVKLSIISLIVAAPFIVKTIKNSVFRYYLIVIPVLLIIGASFGAPRYILYSDSRVSDDARTDYFQGWDVNRLLPFEYFATPVAYSTSGLVAAVPAQQRLVFSKLYPFSYAGPKWKWYLPYLLLLLLPLLEWGRRVATLSAELKHLKRVDKISEYEKFLCSNKLLFLVAPHISVAVKRLIKKRLSYYKSVTAIFSHSEHTVGKLFALLRHAIDVVGDGERVVSLSRGDCRYVRLALSTAGREQRVTKSFFAGDDASFDEIAQKSVQQMYSFVSQYAESVAARGICDEVSRRDVNDILPGDFAYVHSYGAVIALLNALQEVLLGERVVEFRDGEGLRDNSRHVISLTCVYNFTHYCRTWKRDEYSPYCGASGYELGLYFDSANNERILFTPKHFYVDERPGVGVAERKKSVYTDVIAMLIGGADALHKGGAIKITKTPTGKLQKVFGEIGEFIREQAKDELSEVVAQKIYDHFQDVIDPLLYEFAQGGSLVTDEVLMLVAEEIGIDLSAELLEAVTE